MSFPTRKAVLLPFATRKFVTIARGQKLVLGWHPCFQPEPAKIENII